MKEEVFNQYVDKVVSLFNISRDELFKKSKKRELADARQLLYYLCSERPIQITYIEKFMKENGYDINHSTIIHGINVVKVKVAEDRDYKKIIQEIERAVSI